MSIGKVVKMIKEEIAPGILVYNDVIPNSETLYTDIEEGMTSANIEWQGARVKEGGEADTVNTMTRNTQTIGVPYRGQISEPLSLSSNEVFDVNLHNIFFEHFDPVERDYMNHYGVACEWHDTYGVLKYGAGQFFSNHIDDHKDYPRRVSTVYYLNDNYTGGEINFPRFGITFKPKANQMIVFPSNFMYNHSVSPVIEGNRYAVVSWMR
jgi:predicted 2-oxoglutarate/Fe(II)-dependent dioxygenase YbiX